MLHPCGEAVAGDPAAVLTAAGWPVTPLVLYRTATAPALPPRATAALKDGGVTAVTFFSARSATAFAALLAQEGLQHCTRHLSALCLSPAVASAAAILEWREICVASAPTRHAMVECCRRLR